MRKHNRKQIIEKGKQIEKLSKSELNMLVNLKQNVTINEEKEIASIKRNNKHNLKFLPVSKNLIYSQNDNLKQ